MREAKELLEQQLRAEALALVGQRHPLPLAFWSAAALVGQQAECPQCGRKTKGEYVSGHLQTPKCEDCGIPAYPTWQVRDHLGVLAGEVAGATYDEAMESARQSPQFDALHGFALVPKVAL